MELGFDTFFGLPVVNSHPPFVLVEDHRIVGWDPEDPLVYGETAVTKAFDEKFGINEIGGAQEAHARYDDEKLGADFSNRASQWITEKANQDQPFFLYFATHAIHHPFTPDPSWVGTSEAGPYGDFIHELDWMVGEITHALEQNNIAEDTLLIFTSDNGGMLNRGGQEAWRRGHRMNSDLLGFKFDAWEGGHRVPFIARWPGHIESNSESEALVSNIDLLATLAALANIELGPDEGPDSVNLLPALTGPENTQVRERLLISPAQARCLSLREGDWMYISSQGGGGFTAKNVGDHTFGGPAAHRFTGHVNSDIDNGEIKPDAPKAQLYNLKEDPRQLQNVIRERPQIAARMQRQIEDILEKPSQPNP